MNYFQTVTKYQIPTTLFYDDFSEGLDTVNRYTTAVQSGGGGVAASVAVNSGTLVLGSGTNAGGYSRLTTQGAFTPQYPGWVQVTISMSFEYPSLTNSYRFWGLGNVASTPTCAAPIVDGCGWELYTDGKLYAVEYAGGTRNVIADFSPATGTGIQPRDALNHSYILFFRGDRMYWAIDDSIENVVANAFSISGPNTNILPICLLTVANTTPPTSTALLTSGAIYASDTGRNNQQISDGTYPWRKAQVDQYGAFATSITGANLMIYPIGTTGNIFVKSSPGRLGQIYTAASQAITYSVYNAANVGQITAANLVMGGMPLSTIGPIYTTGLRLPCPNGICIVLSGPTTANLTFSWD